MDTLGARDSSCADSGFGKAFFPAASASKGRNTQGDMLQQHVAARSRSNKSPRAYWRIFVKTLVSAIEFCRRNKLHTNEIWLNSCNLLQKTLLPCRIQAQTKEEEIFNSPKEETGHLIAILKMSELSRETVFNTNHDHSWFNCPQSKKMILGPGNELKLFIIW